jgi:hypothetical protein
VLNVNLETSHFVALCYAFLFAMVFHCAFIGLGKTWHRTCILLSFFPFTLMIADFVLPQYVLSGVLYGGLLGGLLLFMTQIKGHVSHFFSQSATFNRFEKRGYIFISIYLLTFIMSSTILRGGDTIQDSLVYHLGGPKEWALHLDGARFNPNNPITFTSSYFDYFYYALFLFIKPLLLYCKTLGTTSYEFFLYVIILTGQIFTAILGFCYIPMILLHLTKKLGIYRFFSIPFILGTYSVTWSWALAKNDAFPLFAILTGVVIAYRSSFDWSKIKKREFLIIGSLIGIAVASKLTNAYIVIFGLIYLFFLYEKNVRSVKNYPLLIGALGLGIIVGLSPFLIRNLYFTGNPVYPTATLGFKNIYLSDYADRPELYSDPGTFTDALRKIKFFMSDHWHLCLVLIAALFVGKIRLVLFFLFLVFFMAKMTGPFFSYRMTSCLLLMALAIYYEVFKEIQRKRQRFLLTVLCLGIIVNSRLRIENLIKIPLNHYSKDVRSSIEKKVPHWDIILQTNLSERTNTHFVFAPKEEIFPYFSRFPAVNLWDSVPSKRVPYKSLIETFSHEN